MKPLQRGQETDLIEIPASWYLDDLPPMMFIKAAPNSHGFVNPRDIEQLWRDQFDWVYREMDYAVYTLTIHPDVSGKPQVLLMLERLFAHINAHPGVRWCTFEEIADDFARPQPAEEVGLGGRPDEDARRRRLLRHRYRHGAARPRGGARTGEARGGRPLLRSPGQDRQGLRPGDRPGPAARRRGRDRAQGQARLLRELRLPRQGRGRADAEGRDLPHLLDDQAARLGRRPRR